MSAKQIRDRLVEMAVARCTRCHATKSLLAPSGAHLPTEVKWRNLQQAGWQFTKHWDRDLCNECVRIYNEDQRRIHAAAQALKPNGHAENNPLLDLYTQLTAFGGVSPAEDRNMYLTVVALMITNIETVLERHYASLPKAAREQIAAPLKSLLETAQLAEIVPLATSQREEAHPVLDWLESLR